MENAEVLAVVTDMPNNADAVTAKCTFVWMKCVKGSADKPKAEMVARGNDQIYKMILLTLLGLSNLRVA